MDEKEILKICLEKGFLVDREVLALLKLLEEGETRGVIEKLRELKLHERVITKAFFTKNFEKIRIILEHNKKREIIEKFYTGLGYARETKVEIQSKDERGAVKEEGKKDDKVKILYSPMLQPKKISVEDFVNNFRARYNQMRLMLQERNLDNLVSLRKISGRDNYSIIVSIIDKRATANKNLIFEVEDMSGRAKVLVNKNKEEIYSKAKDLLLDDIVAFKASGNSEILFANELFFPDARISEKKYAKEDVWAAFSSDFHVGSSMFLESKLDKFISWLNGEEGGEKEQALAKKIKYLFLTGDNIDGVGVYPEQEMNLKIKDIREQYKKLAEILQRIRKDVKIIMCPGQHDGVRVAEPQPIIGEDVAYELSKMENVTLVSNPAVVEIEGFKVLMYHGASFHEVVNGIEELRTIYKHNNPTRIVKELLKRRHLAPMHGSVTYIPGEGEDLLVIKDIPDIVATGDSHRAEVSSYNNILLIASSCWQSKTPFEEKVGNEPDPCKVPVLNLKTREIKIFDFSHDEEKSEEKCEIGKETTVCKLENEKITIKLNEGGKNIINCV
jgi:DNA polymerase II small subunit